MSKSRKIFRLNDEFSIQLQNIVSMCMLTGTNILDHLRQVRLEESSETKGTLTFTPEYLEYHQNTIASLNEEAKLAEEKMMANIAEIADAGETN